jgi:small subunit ribosomal protein S17
MSAAKNTATATEPAKTGAMPQGTRLAVVESDSRDKTRTVVSQHSRRHPKYGKYVRRRTVLQVHDEQNESKKGDIVEIRQCRPVSKSKSWCLVRVVERRAGV